MLQLIIRYCVLALLAWMVHKGIITQELADKNVAGWVDFGVIVATFGGAVLWAMLERWYKGLVKSSPYLPANLPEMTKSPKAINESPVAQTITIQPTAAAVQKDQQ